MSRDADMLRVASLECSTARGSIKEAIANVPDGSPNETEVLNELRIALRAVNEAERLTEHALRIFGRRA